MPSWSGGASAIASPSDPEPMVGSARPSAARPLAAGKLPRAILETLLRYRGARDPRVVLGPGFGRDAAVVRLGELCLVLKSDPVTFTAEEVGWYAVHVNANDLAVLGCRPAWFQATVLLPVGSTISTVQSIARDIHRAARSLGIAVTGGHTEVTPAVSQPVVAGDLQGMARYTELVFPGNARVGELLVMSKTAALEGTAILARSFPEQAERWLGRRAASRAARFHRRPGISVVGEALLAARYGASAMHDPTEGGLRAALEELAAASGKALEVDLDAIPIAPETVTLCRGFSLDPLGLISSGALLAVVPEQRWPALRRAWARRGITGTCIGAVGRGRGVRARSRGKRVRWRWSEQDELARLFAEPAYRSRAERVIG